MRGLRTLSVRLQLPSRFWKGSGTLRGDVTAARPREVRLGSLRPAAFTAVAARQGEGAGRRREHRRQCPSLGGW